MSKGAEFTTFLYKKTWDEKNARVWCVSWWVISAFLEGPEVQYF